MCRWQPFWFLFVGLLALEAVAQEELLASRPSRCFGFFCNQPERGFDPAAGEQFDAFLRFVPPPKPPRPSYTYPFEKYHGRYHNDFLHPFVVTAVTSQFDEHSPFFKHWSSSRSGFDFVQFGARRFGIGFETQRLLVTETDRRSSNPLFTPDNCYASGFQSASACYSPSFREGDRRYGVALRIYLDRPK